ncbi:MAG: cystathionine gamma-synthase family protein [Alphaproteobacteria bacterium]|jgi:cystathionine gamma-synthase/methionine-gamma-lyase|nr:cystathionine gamma-synthase family protein [Alphaproteobacteria bacterium]
MSGGDGLHPDTLTVGAGYDAHAHHGAVKPPMFLTSTFVYPTAQHAKDVHEVYFGARPARPDEASGYIYSRLDHPNMTMLEQRLAVLDGAAEAAVFNSGMAAISTMMQSILRPGQVILHSRPLYGGTDALVHTQLSHFGIRPVGIGDALDPASVRAAAGEAMAAGTVGLVMIETPANPTGGISDIALAAEVAAEIGRAQGHRPPVVVDNTFLGPFQQNPLRHGADLCVTSLTKYAGGHSDLLGGGISGDAAMIGRLKQLRTLLGTHLNPHDCWMLLRSLETMHLRTERAGRNATAIAAFLRDHPKVASVTYLGFIANDGGPGAAAFTRQCRGAGSTFSFRIRGGEAAAFRMLDRLQVIRMAVSLGGTETLICHSATTTHFAVPRERREAMGVDDSTLRISVGVEHEADLIADLDRAMEAV